MTTAREWDLRFLRLLDEPKRWSLEGGSGADHGVAAVVVSPDRRRMSIGYAGFPRGMSDRDKEMCRGNPTLRDAYCRHAERNAIANADCNLEGWTLYVSTHPCLECAIEAHANRIARVVSPPVQVNSRWTASQMDARDFLLRHGVQCECYGQ